MLQIYVKSIDMFHSSENRFTTTKPRIVRLEHSLISISKWESEIKKPFLPAPGVPEKTDKEKLFYISCMLLKDQPSYIIEKLCTEHLEKIKNYMGDNRSATTFKYNVQQKIKPSIITSEQIYSWMIRYNIPIECEKWHISRLLTLIEIMRVQESKSKLPKHETQKKYSALNRYRKKG